MVLRLPNSAVWDACSRADHRNNATNKHHHCSTPFAQRMHPYPRRLYLRLWVRR